jgi:hypothetical protein
MKMREVPGTRPGEPSSSNPARIDVHGPQAAVQGERRKVPVKPKFEKAGEVNAEFQEGGMGAPGPACEPAMQHKH